MGLLATSETWLAIGTASKRKRIEASPYIPPVQSEHIWYDDGNVIIEAENTHFKVHRGVLAKASSKLRESLAHVPNSSEETPVFPIPEKVGEVAHLLSTLYDSTYLLSHHRNSGGPPGSMVAALVRLGHKYGFRQIRDEAAKYLYDEFPTRFKKWKKSDRASFIHVDPEDDEFPMLRLMAVAVECNILTIQPAMCLDIIMSYDSTAILTDFPASDGTSSCNLPTNIKMACLYGFLTLRNQCQQTTYQWLKMLPFEGCEGCEGPFGRSDCSSASDYLYRVIFDSYMKKTTSLCLGFEDWDKKWEANLCTLCVEAAKEVHERGRMKLWYKLPASFGLSSWNEPSNFDE